MDIFSTWELFSLSGFTSLPTRRESFDFPALFIQRSLPFHLFFFSNLFVSFQHFKLHIIDSKLNLRFLSPNIDFLVLFASRLTISLFHVVIYSHWRALFPWYAFIMIALFHELVYRCSCSQILYQSFSILHFQMCMIYPGKPTIFREQLYLHNFFHQT